MSLAKTGQAYNAFGAEGFQERAPTKKVGKASRTRFFNIVLSFFTPKLLYLATFHTCRERKKESERESNVRHRVAHKLYLGHLGSLGLLQSAHAGNFSGFYSFIWINNATITDLTG